MKGLARASIISLMPFLRFLMLLSLAVWLGGLIFFAFVLAPTAFSPGLLPTRHMAGSIVGRSLDRLHYMAIVSGIIFLIASMLYETKPYDTGILAAVAAILLMVAAGSCLLPAWRASRLNPMSALRID